MEELGKMCDLNKAMVFYYFKNKKGLYEAVMQEVLDEIYHTIVKENKKYQNPKQQLKAFVSTYAEFAYEHDYLPSLLLAELSDSGAVISEMLFSSMRQLFALFSDILYRGQKEDYFKDALPMILYFMIIGTLNLMVTTKALRIKASKMNDITVDTCASCDIKEIANYIMQHIDCMLIKEN
jgi:AcrR family transcriptional regulator